MRLPLIAAVLLAVIPACGPACPDDRCSNGPSLIKAAPPPYEPPGSSTGSISSTGGPSTAGPGATTAMPAAPTCGPERGKAYEDGSIAIFYTARNSTQYPGVVTIDFEIQNKTNAVGSVRFNFNAASATKQNLSRLGMGTVRLEPASIASGKAAGDLQAVIMDGATAFPVSFVLEDIRFCSMKSDAPPCEKVKPTAGTMVTAPPPRPDCGAPQAAPAPAQPAPAPQPSLAPQPTPTM